MTQRSQLWVIAGGNGAGKTTFHRLFLAPRGIKLLNADVIAAEINPESPEKAGYRAAHLISRLGEDLLTEGISFCFETVFSHESKIDFVARAKALGYEIILVYIHLDTPALNEARVFQRVTEGGHNVPPEKIRTRIPRTMRHIATALSLADEAHLLNNSSRMDPYREVAVAKRGRRIRAIDPLPKWAQKILKSIPEHRRTPQPTFD
jgi:predicted ABC-type ATPase